MRKVSPPNSPSGQSAKRAAPWTGMLLAKSRGRNNPSLSVLKPLKSIQRD